VGKSLAAPEAHDRPKRALGTTTTDSIASRNSPPRSRGKMGYVVKLVNGSLRIYPNFPPLCIGPKRKNPKRMENELQVFWASENLQ